MFDEATILARLQNGEDAQKIADEMAASLNKVNKLYIDQKAAEEAAKKQNEVQKVEDLQEILNMFLDWFGTHYDVNVAEVKSELTAEAVIELIDSLKEYVEAIKGLESILGSKPAAKPVRVIKSNTKPADADATISQFLNKMGW